MATEWKEYNEEEVRDLSAALLKKSEWVIMATNGSHGHPDVRALALCYFDGANTLWFATNDESSKIKELMSDNSTTLYVYKPEVMEEVRLWGYVDILTDMSAREQIWNPEFIEYFPGGIEDPSMRVLRFTAVSGKFGNMGGEGWITF